MGEIAFSFPTGRPSDELSDIAANFLGKPPSDPLRSDKSTGHAVYDLLLQNLMGPFWLLLCCSFFISLSASAGDCGPDLSSAQAEDPTQLGHEAARLFAEAEKELTLDIHFRGHTKREISVPLASQLDSVAGRLESAGAAPVYLEVFRELAAVLDGRRSVLAYRRRDEVGVVTIQDRDFLSYWKNLEWNSAKYVELAPGLYMTSDARFEVPRTALGDITTLMANSIGRGLTIKSDAKRTNAVVNSHHFMILAKGPSKVYAMEGYELTLAGTGKTRRVIGRFFAPSTVQEAEYYRLMAGHLGIKSVLHKMSRSLVGRNEVFIEARVLFKIENKHKIPIQKLVEALQSPSFPEPEIIGPANSFYSFITSINGRRVKLILKPDHDKFNRLKLMTAYFENDED